MTWHLVLGKPSQNKSKLSADIVRTGGTCARIWSDVTIEQKLEQFTIEVNKALELACPKKLCKRKYKFPTWWNQNLSKLRAKIRFLAKKKKGPLRLESKEAYRSLRREYKNAIISVKDEGWKKFTSEIKYPSDVSKLIKTFNNSKNNALGLLKECKGDYCKNPEDSLNILPK